MLILIKGESESNKIIVRDFSIPLTPVERSSREKINNKIKLLNVTIGLGGSLMMKDTSFFCISFKFSVK